MAGMFTCMWGLRCHRGKGWCHRDVEVKASPHLLVLTISERFLPAECTFRAILANESHWLQLVLVLSIHWWPTPAGMGRVLAYMATLDESVSSTNWCNFHPWVLSIHIVFIQTQYLQPTTRFSSTPSALSALKLKRRVTQYDKTIIFHGQHVV